MVKTMDRNDSIRLMKNTLTVGKLIDLLLPLDDDSPVVLASDYGDYIHTTQLVCIDEVSVINSRHVEDTRYSDSGSCFSREESIEWEYDDELTAAEQVIVLRSPSVREDDAWEMPAVR
jgi:hypothetical protein